MDYSYFSLNNIYLILSFKNKYKTTFNYTYLIFAVAAEIIPLNYIIINLIIYLIKSNLLKFKKNSLNLNFLFLKLIIFFLN
jgi:hypothetical protein